MKQAFVDTQYFIAIFQKSDQWHERALEVENEIGEYRFITTDTVLTEVLNYFSAFGAETRLEASGFVSDVLSNLNFQVIEQTRDVFLTGLELYASRLDKGYSLTDCISMNVCRQQNIREVLTHDRHFEQEGFEILL